MEKTVGFVESGRGKWRFFLYLVMGAVQKYNGKKSARSGKGETVIRCLPYFLVGDVVLSQRNVVFHVFLFVGNGVRMLSSEAFAALPLNGGFLHALF